MYNDYDKNDNFFLVACKINAHMTTLKVVLGTILAFATVKQYIEKLPRAIYYNWHFLLLMAPAQSCSNVRIVFMKFCARTDCVKNKQLQAIPNAICNTGNWD